MKRAFLVLGPESSGTRLMTQILITAGCFGDSDHEQRLDDRHFMADCDEPLIVWRRSLPHGNGHEWPDIGEHIQSLQALGYTVTAVVMSRDWHAMIESQQGQHTDSREAALFNIRRAYPHIFTGLGNCAYELVGYEAITGRPSEVVPKLLRRLGLCDASVPYIYDGNARHYHESLAHEIAVRKIVFTELSGLVYEDSDT